MAPPSHHFLGLSLRGPSLTLGDFSGYSAHAISNVGGENANIGTMVFASYTSKTLASAHHSLDALTDDELADFRMVQFENTSRMARHADEAWEQHFGATFATNGGEHISLSQWQQQQWQQQQQQLQQQQQQQQ